MGSEMCIRDRIYEVEFVKADMGSEGLIGLMAAGAKQSLGSTEASVDLRLRDWSRKEVDQTYGTTEFLQRGFSKRFTAKLLVDDSTGSETTPDEQWGMLAAIRGTPCLWDFSNDSTTMQRLWVFGFFREALFPTSGLWWLDGIELEMEGLVE